MTKKSLIGPMSNSFENSFGKEIKRTVADDIGGMGSEFFSQLLGFSMGKKKEQAAEQPTIKPNQGEIFNIANIAKSADKKQTERVVAKPERRAAAIEYYDYHREIINSRKTESRKELGEMNNRIQQIQVELKKLIATSKVLQIEFGSFVVEQAPTNPGQYYINFFEWMLVIIRSAREKAESSRAWLGTMKGKHGKKLDYWDMYKKHGTSFGLSGERVVATQVG